MAKTHVFPGGFKGGRRLVPSLLCRSFLTNVAPTCCISQTYQLKEVFMPFKVNFWPRGGKKSPPGSS